MATVLIVDDDPKLLTMLRRTLAYEGFHVFSATNGTEALEELQASRPSTPASATRFASLSAQTPLTITSSPSG